jgi:hypothetical protein
MRGNMAGLDGSVEIAGHSLPKKQVALGVGGVVVVAVLYEVKKRRSAGAGSSVTAASDSSGSGQVDPVTGYAYGSPEDVAALQGSTGSDDSSSSVSGDGQVVGYTEDGAPVYGAGGVSAANSGPGYFTSNAEWAQAFESQVGSSGDDATAAALGKYLTGSQVTPAQQTIIQEAIASQGAAPVSGSTGYPPNIRLIAGSTGTTTTGTGVTVAVPRVTGMRAETALNTLKRAGLLAHFSEPINPKATYSVTSQTPGAGNKVPKGSTIDLGIKSPA